MPDALDDAAEDVRSRLGIPDINSPESRSSVLDGWRVGGRSARQIGLIRVYDVDLLPGPDHVQNEPRLLARELMDHMRDPRVSTHVSSSFAQMDAASHHVDDPALVLAITSRESSPRVGVTTSARYRCTYHYGGADNAYGSRNELDLPQAVRRRLRPASDPSGHQCPGIPPSTHVNEACHPIEPADVRGRDQLILYAAYVLRAGAQLRAQVRNVFSADPDAIVRGMTRDARRAWTQLSFGRGGGGGLVRALRRARDLGDIESIFTDAEMVEADSVKRARVTAGDASLIDQFVLRGMNLGAHAPMQAPPP